MKIVFASGNKHKLEEIKAALPGDFEIISMRDLPVEGEIEEHGTTLEGNAAIKARFIHEHFGQNCFADDTGLEIAALGGAPGVYSARYAGEGCSFSDNVKKVLGEMEGKTNREAQFRTVICLILEGREYFFEGTVKGAITRESRGTGGFGYDPIFVPEGEQRTFAQMDMKEKNTLSHRALAVRELARFLGAL